MNEISGYLSGYAGYFAVIGLAAIGIVALYIRRSNERYRKAMKARRGYNCLSANMAWGGEDNPDEEQTSSGSMHRGR